MFDRYIITKDTIWQISVFLGKFHTRTSSNATEQSLSFNITSCLPLLSYLSLSLFFAAGPLASRHSVLQTAHKPFVCLTCYLENLTLITLVIQH